MPQYRSIGGRDAAESEGRDLISAIPDGSGRRATSSRSTPRFLTAACVTSRAWFCSVRYGSSFCQRLKALTRVSRAGLSGISPAADIVETFVEGQSESRESFNLPKGREGIDEVERG